MSLPKLLAALAVGLLLLIFLLAYFGVERVLAAIASIDGFLFLLSITFLLLMHVILAFRILYISSLLSAGLSFKDAFFTHMLGMLLSEFTPGRSGYMAAPLYLKAKGVDTGKALAVVIAPQPFDYAAKLLGALSALILLFNLPLLSLLFPFLLVLLFSLAVYSSTFASLIRTLLSPLMGLPFLSSLLPKALSYLTLLQENARLVKDKWYVMIAFVVLSYTARVANWAFLFYALHLSIGTPLFTFLLFFLLQPFISLVEFLPLPSSAGSGFSESLSVFVFSSFGVSPPSALAFALLLRLQSILISMVGTFPLLEAYAYLKDFLSRWL